MFLKTIRRFMKKNVSEKESLSPKLRVFDVILKENGFWISRVARESFEFLILWH